MIKNGGAKIREIYNWNYIPLNFNGEKTADFLKRGIIAQYFKILENT